MDSQYVSGTLAVCLSQGLAELLEQRPPDPIEFLALWILKYKHNQELQQQKLAYQRLLEEEQQRLQAESLHQKLLQDEETRIRAAQEQIQVTQTLQESDGEPTTDAAQDPGDQTESESVKEPTDPPAEDQEANKEESGEAVAGEEQTPEILNTDQSQSQEEHSDTQKEPDVPSEENKADPEKTEEDSDERQMETQDKTEDFTPVAPHRNQEDLKILKMRQDQQRDLRNRTTASNHR
ncbi:DPY30 domain-containing 1-like protein [Labeo rohita]|uniref:DPY30 domain-containing 1-like protein n=1 Tax=Labeo rohita TaxID=84645 RepID=A0A498LME6_LABRO|nr:DPY30 domain-containing 1-like protein [Labeo rohita]